MVIEQWGNGLKLIFEELLQYPNIKMQWKDIGMAFRVTFINTVFTKKQELQPELQPKLQPELQPVLQRELQNETLYSLTLYYLEETPLNTRELSLKMNQKEISGQLRKVIRKLHDDNLIENSISGSPNHPAQKHQLTLTGKVFLKFLKEVKTNNT